MAEQVYKFDGEGHTLSCLLEGRLFEAGAKFAACVVPHPQDEFLNVHIDASHPKRTLVEAMRSARAELLQLRESIMAECSGGSVCA